MGLFPYPGLFNSPSLLHFNFLKMKAFQIFFVLLICTLGFSCRKTFENPAEPTLEELLKTQDGIVEIVIGMKNRFAVNSIYGNGALFNTITANGFTTFELSLRPGGNQDINQLFAGKQNLATNNSVLKELWSNCLLINNHCSFIKANINNVQDPVLKDHIVKYVNLYKALSIGTMVNFWEKVPVTTSDKADFIDSTEALKFCNALLNEAAMLPNMQLAQPYLNRLGTEINLTNTINALSARYYMMRRENDSAIIKAALVGINPSSASSRSVFVFNNLNPNPLFSSGFNGTFGFNARPGFGLTGALSPVSGDSLRTSFYTVNNQPPGIFGYGFGKALTDAIPVYMPGEMLLIQAEAYTRKGDYINGKKFLDSVLKKTPAQDVFGVGANLPAYTGPLDAPSLLKEIYKNRCIELFMSGMKLSDSRRFLRPGPNDLNAERNRNYYPYPLQERSGNPKTPADPLN
jgi:starch-binding outer membrane protein, SusD/RagB family